MNRNAFTQPLFSAIHSGALAVLILFSTVALAQTQPPQAVNQQDEVVTIHLGANQGADDVLQILRSSDKFETNGYVSQVIEIFNTESYELKPYITEAVTQEKGVVRAVKTEAPEGQKPRYFLLVTTTAAQLPTIAEAIRALDVPGFVNSQGRSRVAFRLKYRLASELGAILRGTRLTSQGRIFADDKTNTLYYDDSPYVIKKVEEYVTFFDVPTPQVEFDVQIVEVRDDDSWRLGLDWDAWKRSIGGQFDITGNYFEGGDSFARVDGLLTLDAATLASFLNYTVQSGSARLVQRSRLNASNLNPAVISDMRRVPFYDYKRTERVPSLLTETTPQVDAEDELDTDEGNARGPRTVTIVPPVHNQRADLGTDEEGLLVTIRPIIGTEIVTAKVDISLNTLNGYDEQNRPIVTEQDLSNEFRVRDNDPLLLGTLERQTSVEGRRGLPGLKNIPIIKYAFSVEDSRSTSARLFIIATPAFSNVGFDAKNLADLKTRAPLRIVEKELLLDDPKIEQNLQKLDAAGR